MAFECSENVERVCTAFAGVFEWLAQRAGHWAGGSALRLYLGAPLGPNLTTVGSLATMLWIVILQREGVEISPLSYVKLGLTVVPVMIVGGALMIALSA